MAKAEVKAVDNPLAIDKEHVKELKIPAQAELSPVHKLTFLQNQLEEFKLQAWRSRVDAIHAKRLIQSDVEALQNKGHQNLSEHKNAAIRLSEGIVMTARLIEQLREEYPELQVED